MLLDVVSHCNLVIQLNTSQSFGLAYRQPRSRRFFVSLIDMDKYYREDVITDKDDKIELTSYAHQALL